MQKLHALLLLESGIAGLLRLVGLGDIDVGLLLLRLQRLLCVLQPLQRVGIPAASSTAALTTTCCVLRNCHHARDSSSVYVKAVRDLPHPLQGGHF